VKAIVHILTIKPDVKALECIVHNKRYERYENGRLEQVQYLPNPYVSGNPFYWIGPLGKSIFLSVSIEKSGCKWSIDKSFYKE